MGWVSFLVEGVWSGRPYEWQCLYLGQSRIWGRVRMDLILSGFVVRWRLFWMVCCILLLFVEYVCCVSCASFVLFFVFELVGPFFYGWLWCGRVCVWRSRGFLGEYLIVTWCVWRALSGYFVVGDFQWNIHQIRGVLACLYWWFHDVTVFLCLIFVIVYI